MFKSVFLHNALIFTTKTKKKIVTCSQPMVQKTKTDLKFDLNTDFTV